MNPDKISNEDYVVDSDEIMEDVTQEKNAENDKDQQEIEKMENLLQEMYETDFMSLQLEEKQTQLAGKRKKLHDETFMAFLAHAGDAKALMCLLKNFATMDTQGILTKHRASLPSADWRPRCRRARAAPARAPPPRRAAPSRTRSSFCCLDRKQMAVFHWQTH